MITGFKRHYPGQPALPIEQNLLRALECSSWRQHEANSRRDDRPSHRRQAQQYLHHLLSSSSYGDALPLQLCRGAYFDPHSAILALVDQYRNNHMLLPHPRQLQLVRLSYDNRSIWGPNEGVVVSLPNVADMHAPRHQFPLLTYAGKEVIELFRPAVTESQLDSAVSGLDGAPVDIGQEKMHQLHFMVSAD